MDDRITFLLIDNEEQNISAFRTLIPKISPDARIIIAHDGAEGLEEYRKLKNNIIIMCGCSITEISYVQLLKIINIPNDSKPFYFIAVNPIDTENEFYIKLFALGADDFIKKPFQLFDIISKIRSAVRIVKSNIKMKGEHTKVAALEEEFNKYTEKIIKFLISLQEDRIPSRKGQLQKTVEVCEWVITQLENVPEEEADGIIKAANLTFIGRINLDDAHIQKPIMQDGLVRDEKLALIPRTAKEIALSLRGYKAAAQVLNHIYENFDGTGIPEKIKGWQIPLGSRLLRIALDYFDLMESFNNNESKAVDVLYHESKRLYDYKLVAIFEQYLAEHSYSKGRRREVPVILKDLKPGMYISRHVIAESGTRLLSPGVTVNDESIEKLHAIHKQDPILGKIYIMEMN